VRHIDDQSPDLSFAYGSQLGGDDFEVPVHRQVGLRIEVLEAASGESREVMLQQELVLGSTASSRTIGRKFAHILTSSLPDPAASECGDGDRHWP
jgi:hypothetical protein